MLASYLVTAIRAIKKDSQHFILNLIGFSIGVAGAILMALFVQHEMSYDKQHPDSSRVYLAHSDHTARGLQRVSMTRFSVADAAKNHSQLETVFKLTHVENVGDSISDLIELDGNYYRLKDLYTATDNLLEFMALKVLTGDIEQVLTAPGKIALSEREAIRLFASTNIIGRTINHEQGQYSVGAVFENLPENTHFKFDALTHMPEQVSKTSTGYTYYKLLPSTDISAFKAFLTQESHKLYAWEVREKVTMDLVNMERLHLDSNGPFTMKEAGSAKVLNICIGLSLVLMLIASINFINLNIAQSAKRAKEVGVRKALGATKGQLVFQFLTESFVVVACAALLAFTLVELSLPSFNSLMDRELSLVYSAVFTWAALAVILAVGLLSGLYPALFIASFSAKRVLSGDLVRGGTAIFIRKLTLCLQGALSVGLIIAAISLYQQMQLVNSLEVGYEKTSRLVVKGLPNDALYKSGHNSLFASIRELAGVDQVTASNTDLTSDMEFDLSFTWPNGETLTAVQPTVSTGYYPVETLGLTLIAGREFTPAFSGDWYQQDEQGNIKIALMVSRRMAELAGYTNVEEVVGMTVRDNGFNIEGHIVGVIEDVKIGSARQQALPMSVNLGLTVPASANGNLVVKASSADLAQLTRQLEQIIHKELHLSDVEITRVSDDYAQVHKNENQALEMVSIFSLLAIFLTCLGTFGLASFATLRRQKEVAVRKVLGASRISIVNLLAKEFLFLVLISIVIAFPLSYWLVTDWLANFNERITQTIWVYLLAATVVTCITWLTVASLGFKAASTRPSLILRDE